MIGYIVEIISVSIIERKVILSRGFLIGPYLPIYGVGAILMTCFLQKYQNDLLVLFVMGTLLCSLLEYFTSLIMEKIFKLRWWDYSDKKFNINGRICLENGVLFGLGGVVIVKVVNPIFQRTLSLISEPIIIIVGIFLSLVFIVDLGMTIYIMVRLKINTSKYTNKDATLAIKKEVRKALAKHATLTTRLIQSFPNIQNNANYKVVRDAIFKARLEMKKLKEEYKQKRK